MSLSSIERQIVTFVRQLPDEQILDLVRDQLAAGDATAAPAPKSNAPKATRQKRRGRGGKAMDRLAERVLVFVLSSDGVAVKDVAEGLGVPKPKASTALRGLRDAGKIVQAGDRRFARYGATKEVAEAASSRARGLN